MEKVKPNGTKHSFFCFVFFLYLFSQVELCFAIETDFLCHCFCLGQYFARLTPIQFDAITFTIATRWNAFEQTFRHFAAHIARLTVDSALTRNWISEWNLQSRFIGLLPSKVSLVKKIRMKQLTLKMHCHRQLNFVSSIDKYSEFTDNWSNKCRQSTDDSKQ